MSFLDDLEGNFRTRVNRVNPNASIFKAPEDEDDDWLKKSVKRFAETGRQRMAEIESGRRKRFIDDAEGSNFGNDKTPEARGRRGLMRYSQSEEGSGKGFNALAKRPAGMLDALTRKDVDFKALGQKWTNDFRDNAGKQFDTSEPAREFIKSRTSSKTWDIFDDFKDEFEQNKGRGVKWEEWRRMADTDPVGFLAANVNNRALPPDVKALVDERRASQPGIYGFYRGQNRTPIAGAIQQFTDSDKNVFNRGKTKMANRFVGGMAAGMAESAIERPASALSQAGLEAVGRRDLAQNVDKNTGTTFRDNTWQQNLGLGIDSAVTAGSMLMPGAFSGKLLQRIAAKAGVKVGSKLGIRGLAVAEGFGANAAIDLPGTMASMKLQGYDDKDIVNAILPTLAGDLFAAGGVGLARETNTKAFKAIFGNDYVGNATATGVAAYAGARATGSDNERALAYAATASAATLAYTAARLGGNARRSSMVRELPEGTEMMHGRGTNDPLEGPMRESNAQTSPNGKTSYGDGLYVFVAGERKRDIMVLAAEDWAEGRAKLHKRPDDPDRGVSIVPLETAQGLRLLDGNKPITLDEFESILQANWAAATTKGTPGKLEQLDRYRDIVSRGKKTGEEAVKDLSNMLFADSRYPTFRGTDMDGLIVSHARNQTYAAVISEPGNKVRSAIGSPMAAARRRFMSQPISPDLPPGHPDRMGHAPLPKAQTQFERNLDGVVERFRGEDGLLHMSADEIQQAFHEAHPGAQNFPGNGTAYSLDDFRYAVERGMPGAHWYSAFAPMLDALTGGNRVRDAINNFAVTSQQAPPDVNLAKMFNGMRAINDLTEGGKKNLDEQDLWLVVGEGTDNGMDSKQVKKLADIYNEWYTHNTTPGAAKTPSYAQNLRDALLKRYSAWVTVDTHHGAFFGLFKGGVPKGGKGKFEATSAAANKTSEAYLFAQRLTQHIAAEMGLDPMVVQAAAWETMKKIKEASDGKVASLLTSGKVSFRQAAVLAGGYPAAGSLAETMKSPIVSKAYDDFQRSLEQYPSSGVESQFDFAPPKQGKLAEGFEVSDARGAELRADVEGRSPILDISTKASGGRDANFNELLGQQPNVMRDMGYDPATRRFQVLDDMHINHEVIEESMGSFEGPEPNFRVRLPGANWAKASFAGAILAKKLEAAGRPQDAVAIIGKNSNVASHRGLSLQKPDKSEWTPEEFAALEQRLYDDKTGVGPTMAVGDKTTVQFNDYEGVGVKFFNNTHASLEALGYDPTTMVERAGDSELLWSDKYDATIQSGQPLFDPERLYRPNPQQVRAGGSEVPEANQAGGLAGGGEEAGLPGLGFTEGTASQASDPMTQAALRAGGAAAYGFATEDGDVNERLTKAAEYGLASGVTSVAGTSLGNKIAGGLARTGKYVTDPAEAGPGARNNADIEMAMMKSAETVAKMKEPVKDVKAEAKARIKKVEDKKTAKLLKRKLEAVAPPEQVTAFEKLNDDYLVHAESMIDDPHYMNRVLSKVKGIDALVKAINTVADPAANKTSYFSKKVLASTVASVDYLRTTAGTQSLRANKLIDELAPLVGKENHIANAARQGAALATPVAAGYVAGEATGDDRFKELGIIAGAGAMGLTSGRQAKHKFANRPWENVRYRGLSPNDRLPEQLRSGPGKLYDIIQNPERYDLTREQNVAIGAYYKAHDAMTRETNAALQSAGSEVIPFREQHGILQFFTEDSVRRVFGEAGATAFRMDTPGFDRKRSPQQLRDLGPTYESVLREHPKLELVSDPLQLLKLEVKRHDQIRANAMLVRNLKESGGAWKVPTEAEVQKLDKQGKLDMKAHTAQLERDGWKRLPGIDDHLFNPEIIKTVDELLLPARGSDTGPLAVADGLTNVLRQAMFTGDLSAWTMQGAMAAINDPIGTIRNAPHLIGASVFGKRYFDWWVERNPEIWENYTKSGGVGGLEHEGLEKRGKLSLSHVPGIKQIEERGFEAFLPIHRASMHNLLTQQEQFIKGLGPKKLGKVPLGRRLASEFLKNGPLAAGIGVALSDVDIPGIDDQYEAAFALALGLGSNIGTRAALNAEARYAGETLPRATVVKANVQAAKQVNRTSGAFNRQSLGITANHAQWERTLGARSPALLRNTLILAKKATTDFGPEGAMARFYLVKTAALLGTGMAGLQFLATGEMPSLNPMDDESIFNPKSQNFLKAQGDASGSLTASNPLVSLVKAFMRTDSPDGVRKWRMEDWVPMVGLSDWYAARTPDVFGAFSQPVVNSIGNSAQAAMADTGIGAEGGSPGFDRPLFQPPVPLVAKASFKTGVIQNHSSIGGYIEPVTDKLGLEADESYNNGRERAFALLSTFQGMNHRPESLGREMSRIKTDEVNRQFPNLQDRPGISGQRDGVVDYNDLNQEEQGGVRGELEKDGHYTELKEKVGKDSAEENSPVQAYFSRLEGINANYEQKMQDLDARYKAKKTSAFDAKEEYQFLAEMRRKEISDAKADLGKLAAERKGTDEDVLGYLSRYMKPEDTVINDWYGLFDEATGRDGKLDFNKLEKLQTAFKEKTPPEYRTYLDRRLAAFDKEPTTQFGKDYDKAKENTRGYYDTLDKNFEALRGQGIFAGFESYGDFESAVGEEAAKRGMTPDQLIDALGSSDKTMRRFNALVKRDRLRMRRDNPSLDASLVDFYGKTPVKGSSAYRAFKLNQRETLRDSRNGGLFTSSFGDG